MSWACILSGREDAACEGPEDKLCSAFPDVCEGRTVRSVKGSTKIPSRSDLRRRFLMMVKIAPAKLNAASTESATAMGIVGLCRGFAWLSADGLEAGGTGVVDGETESLYLSKKEK